MTGINKGEKVGREGGSRLTTERGRKGGKKLKKEGKKEAISHSYQNHECANLFHFLETSIRTTGCCTAS